MKNSSIFKRCNVAIAIIWLLLVALWMGLTMLEVPMDTDVKAVKNALVSKLYYKDQCVDVNGGWIRLLGQRRCNGVVRLKNGGLVFIRRKDRKDRQKARLAECCEYLKARNTPHIVALAPQKMTMDDSLGYGGWPRLEYNEIADGYIDFFVRNSIQHFDMRREFCSSADMVERAFYKTDLHWKFDSALCATRLLMPILAQMCGEADSQSSVRDCMNRFVLHDLARSFCGSYGKRTGILFSGVDFPVHYFTYDSCDVISKSMPVRNKFCSGTFDNSVINWSALEQPKSHFEDRFYECYENGLTPFVRYRHAAAPIKKKLLMVKDSFAMPVAAMASVVFAAVDVIDPRNFKDVDFYEYVQAVEPDVVCFVFNTSGDWMPDNSFWANKPSFSADNGEDWEIVYEKPRMNLSAGTNSCYYAKVCEFSGDAGCCRIIIGDVQVVEGEQAGITVSVQDVEMKKEVRIDTFAIDADTLSKFHIIFPISGLDENRKYKILVYAGVRGQTANTRLVVKDFRLEKLNNR